MNVDVFCLIVKLQIFYKSHSFLIVHVNKNCFKLIIV